ncbi:MAG: plastocyanin/azurin family copper-binding protein [Hyphomicrobiales bacterium]
MQKIGLSLLMLGLLATAGAPAWVALNAQAAANNTVDVPIKLFQFTPNKITIKKSTTVIWVNQDAIDHSVTSGPPKKADGVFDSGFFKKDGRYQRRFDQFGTFAYFCRRHPSMIGVVEVVE